MLMRPRVSVVIPTYNRADVLPRAVKSVLTQTFQDFEIIIVDDCSKDNTAEVVAKFTDPRIKYIRHDRNKGGNAARNTGVKAALGSFVAFLDSDDQWLPEKLERQLTVFNNPAIGLVYCGLIFIGPGKGEASRWFVRCGQDFRQDLLVSNFIGTTSAVIVRRGLLKEINGFDESLKSCQDWDLYLRLSKLCEFGYVEDFLVRYQFDRKTRSQISNSPEAVMSGQRAIEHKYSREIEQLPKNKKIERNDYLLKTYVGMAHPEGISKAWKGFVLTGNPKYCFFMFKITIKFLLRKCRLL